MPRSTAGKAMLSFVAALLAVTMSAGSVQAAAGGGVRGSRRLGAADDIVEGFRRLPRSGICSKGRFAKLPSYDAITFVPGTRDGREICKKMCDAVNCPAFNYAPAGPYYPFWWLRRYRWAPYCIVYHDHPNPMVARTVWASLQTVANVGKHYIGASAFHTVPTTADWFFRDWDWANGECYVARWREEIARFWGEPPVDNGAPNVKLPEYRVGRKVKAEGMGYASQSVADWCQSKRRTDMANGIRYRTGGNGPGEAWAEGVAVGTGGYDDGDDCLPGDTSPPCNTAPPCPPNSKEWWCN